jgi:Na+-transporting methylmalonyl-CoA/oxaloacetate decarboxylase gamma subunit
MGHAMHIVLDRMDPRHWMHVPQKRTVVKVALALVVLVAAVTALSRIDTRSIPMPAPVPAVETQHIAATPVAPAVALQESTAAQPATATTSESARPVVKLEQPLIIYGTIPK